MTTSMQKALQAAETHFRSEGRKEMDPKVYPEAQPEIVSRSTSIAQIAQVQARARTEAMRGRSLNLEYMRKLHINTRLSNDLRVSGLHLLNQVGV